MFGRLIAIAVGFAMFSPTMPASSDPYLVGRSGWTLLGPSEKHRYVSGLHDGLFGTAKTEGTYAHDISRCLHDMRILSTALVDLLDAAYRKEANRSRSPVAVFQDSVRQICLVYVNNFREYRGEPPLQP